VRSGYGVVASAGRADASPIRSSRGPGLQLVDAEQRAGRHHEANVRVSASLPVPANCWRRVRDPEDADDAGHDDRGLQDAHSDVAEREAVASIPALLLYDPLLNDAD
jgi:hypothetical protein